MEDAHVSIVDMGLRRQFLLMEVIMRAKVQKGQDFPEFNIFPFTLMGEKRIFSNKSLGKHLSVFIHQGKQCLLPSSVLFISKIT